LEVSLAQATAITKSTKATPHFNVHAFLAKGGTGRTIADRNSGQVIFSQGDAADSIFYIQKGRIKMTVVSSHGKEAIIAILGTGDFFGEECLAVEGFVIPLLRRRLPCVGGDQAIG
jgi:CRP/FNR family transcriptional regulator, cyclic AMP receptor protein